MKKLIALLSTLVAVTSYATPILPGPETPLQTILNNNVTGIPGGINVNTSQVADNTDFYWTADSSVSAYMLIEIAGYAGNNTFGIYKKGSPGTKQQIFGGSVTGPSSAYSVAIPASWDSFGFYLKNTDADFTWYSDDTLNSGGGLDHFAFFQGAVGGKLNNWTFDANDYVIAMEDLNLGDKDYNDMVVLVQNIKRVPDSGTTLMLLGLAFSALALFRRKAA